MTTKLRVVFFRDKRRKNNLHKKVIVLLLLFFTAVSFSFSATRTASVSGNWSSTATWGGASIPTASDDVIINGGVTVTVNTTASCKTLTIANSGVLNVGGGNDLTVSGATNISGTLTLSTYGGTKIFGGLVTINPGGNWNNTGNSPVTFRGGITNNGTFSAGNMYTFDTNNQALTGDFSNMINAPITITGISLTNNGTLNISKNITGTGTFINATTGTFNSSSYITIANLVNKGVLVTSSNNLSPTNLTNSGTMNISGSAYTSVNTLTNTGTINYNSSKNLGANDPSNFINIGTVNVYSNGYINGLVNSANTSFLNIYALGYSINSLTATATGNTVNYCGAGDQTLKQTTYSNLKLTGSGTKQFPNSSLTVNDSLTIITGVKANLSDNVTHTAKYLFFNEIQQAAGSWGSTGSLGRTPPAKYTNDVYFTAANSGIINVSYGPNFWKGTNSTDWGTASNWTANTVPLTGKDVIYATDAVRDLILDINRVVGNITNATSKRLIIPAGKSLTVQGTIAPATDPNLILIKAAVSQPNGSLIFTKPAANTAVNATVEMYTIGYNGAEQIQYDPDNVPYKVTYRWQYFGIPVKTVTASPTHDGSWVREYNETINLGKYYQKWTQLQNSSPMTPFTGYEITQNISQGSSKLITYQGTLVTGDKILNLTYTGDASFYGRGYNIFGNSYTAAIDISKMTFGSGVEQTVYIYNTGSLKDWGDQKTNTTGGAPGRYLAIPQQTSPVIGNEIPSMQGFLLITSNAATVTIPYNATANALTKNTTPQRVGKIDISENETNATDAFSYLKMEVKNDSTYDTAWIFDAENTSHLFDNGWDGYRLNGMQGTSLFSDEETGELQVNTLDNIDEVYLKFMAGKEDTYTLTIQAENILDKYNDLYLKDLSTGTSVKLEYKVTTYHFTAKNTESAERRFLIGGIKKDMSKINPFKIIDTLGKLTIKNTGTENGTLYLYDAIGRTILTHKLDAQTTINITDIQKGVYIANCFTEKGKEYNQKVVVR